MKLSIRFLIVLIAVITITLIISLNTGSTQAQNSCKSFDAVGQLIIPTTNPLVAGYKWGGNVYVKMGEEYLQGLISGDDGLTVRQHNVGHATGGLYTIGFNCVGPVPGSTVWTCTDTIKIDVPNSIFGPGAPIFDQYQGNSAYFDGGTGRFASATGDITFRGPYIVWNTGGTPPRNGRFNPEINGTICGVE
jgi:hypothetical protein